MRGFFAIGAEGISKPMNLGNLIRSAHAFGASFVFLVNADYAVRSARSDTSQAEFQLPVYDFASVAELQLPRGCRLVGCELVDDAVELPSFRHPPQRRLRVRARAQLAVARRCWRAATTWCASRRDSASISRSPARSSCMIGCSRSDDSRRGRYMSADRPRRCRIMSTAPSSGSAGGGRLTSSRRERWPALAPAVRCFRSPCASHYDTRVTEMIFAAARIPMRHWLRGALVFTMLAIARSIARLGPGAETDRLPTGPGRSTRSPTVAAGSAIWRASRQARPGTSRDVTTRRYWSCVCPGKSASMSRVHPGYPYKKDSKVKVTVDGRGFDLFTDGEHAFSFDADDQGTGRRDEARQQHDRARHVGQGYLLARHLLAQGLHRRHRRPAGRLCQVSPPRRGRWPRTAVRA